MAALDNSITKHIFLCGMESMEWRDSNSQFVKIHARAIHCDRYETIGAGSCSFIEKVKNVCINIQHEDNKPFNRKLCAHLVAHCQFEPPSRAGVYPE